MIYETEVDLQKNSKVVTLFVDGKQDAIDNAGMLNKALSEMEKLNDDKFISLSLAIEYKR